MKKFLALLLALILSLTLFAGCGSKPKEETTAGDDEGPIYVGVLAVQTGDMATLGTTCYVSKQIALDKINAAGGVMGRQVEFVTLDTSGDPTECVECAKQLLEDERICAILGPVRGSVEGPAACAVTNEEAIVTLLPICSISDFCGSMGEYVFSMAGKQSFEMPHLAKAVLSDAVDAKSVAILYKNNEWGVSSIEALVPECEANNITVTACEPYVESETDFTTVLTKLRQTNPDALVLISEAVDGAAVLTQVQQLGWDDVTLVGCGAMYSDQTFSFAAEGAAEGLITTTAYFVSEADPIGYEYAQEFESRAGYPPTVHGPLSYDSVLMLCAAIEKAQSLDRTAIKDALFELQDVEGIAGPYTFTPDGDIERNYQVIVAHDGAFEPYVK